jgi:3-dehydroquinate synthase
MGRKVMLDENNIRAEINVDLGERSYKIYSGKNLLSQADVMISPFLKRKRVFVITDSNVESLHRRTLEESLRNSDISSHWSVITAGEGSKNFANLQKILAEILAHAPERNDLIIAFGGGVIGDLAGFAASILLRGISFIQIPTTLLAMVDSSVGGKTGINTEQGKNLVGTFYQPKMVIMDLSLLDTLPQREILAGYAEIVKYGLLGDAEFFFWLEENYRSVLEKETNALAYAISKSCLKKAEIVAKDEREGNVRALLNLGHTFGHALEKRTFYSDRLLHGEAVALGIILAFEYSAWHGLCSEADASRVLAHIRAVGLPDNINDLELDVGAKDLVSDMLQDKKVQGGKLTLILAKAIGDCFVTSGENVNFMEEFWQKKL